MLVDYCYLVENEMLSESCSEKKNASDIVKSMQTSDAAFGIAKV